MAEQQFGPYRLVRQVAVGGMAEIHLAKTKGIAGFEKYVAIKMIHPNFAEDEQFIQMLVDEAKIAVQLNHGNIAQTFDLGRVGDTYYITMEYVDGADLYKLLRRSSEIELETPLDVCAFVGKEIASALDHAHRKKDHTGKNLGIVHRDVSPQNVLISYSGEVKLVDFGIAKATMKARQTAVGVIKGKYYYMSPEQARGDVIDWRSDIFSAGIVVYEMITGQMLYLEEDLQKLLDMARRADIAPPSKLRRGVPPQLERIVMRALAKRKEDRYQSAMDFATDLERFLHTYSPVFTAAKLAGLLKQVLGDPQAVPVADDPDIEVRDGPNATHTLDASDLIHDKEEIRDENSVIFRVEELRGKTDPPQKSERAPTKAAKPRQAHEHTRELSPSSFEEDGLLVPPKPFAQPKQPTPKPQPAVKKPLPGILDDVKTPSVARDEWQGETVTGAGSAGDDSGHDRTMITGAPSGVANYLDAVTDDGVDATMVSRAPSDTDTDPGLEGATMVGRRGPDTFVDREPAPADDDEPSPEDFAGDTDTGSPDDGPTTERDFRDRRQVPTQREGQSPRTRTPASAPPPALAAKIHAPAVSEIRKPRASRKTPSAGTPSPNVLQQLVGAAPVAPMPAPRGAPRNEDSGMATLMQRPGQLDPPTPQPQPPQQPPPPQPVPYPMQQQPGFAMQQPQAGFPMPAQGYPQAQPGYPGYPSQAPPAYPQQPGYPPQQAPYPPQQAPYPAQHMTPGAMYGMNPFGAPPRPMSLTGQVRLFEADELPPQYKVQGAGRWLRLVVAGALALSVAAGVTFFVIRGSKDLAPAVGSIKVVSIPAGAEVTFDGNRLTDKTPMTIPQVPAGTRHDIRVDLARHHAKTETVDIPKEGGEVQINAELKPITGKIVVNSTDGAEIWIDGQLRGFAPKTLPDIDMESAKQIELRLKDYQPYSQPLEWPANGEIQIDHKLQR